MSKGRNVIEVRMGVLSVITRITEQKTGVQWYASGFLGFKGVIGQEFRQDRTLC